MGQKDEKFREFRTPFPPRDIRKNPRSMYARVPQAMAQFVLKIELLSHIMGTAPILEIARAYGLRTRFMLHVGGGSRGGAWGPGPPPPPLILGEKRKND